MTTKSSSSSKSSISTSIGGGGGCGIVQNYIAEANQAPVAAPPLFASLHRLNLAARRDLAMLAPLNLEWTLDFLLLECPICTLGSPTLTLGVSPVARPWGLISQIASRRS